MDRWNIVATLNYLPHDDEVNIVLAKAPSYDTEAGRKTIGAMVRLADLTRAGFINGDISTVMTPRTVITWAENANIFNDVGFALPRHLPQQVRRAGAAGGGRVLPALLRHGSERPATARRSWCRGGFRTRAHLARTRHVRQGIPPEEFKRVTGATMRAISRKHDLTVSFAPGQRPARQRGAAAAAVPRPAGPEVAQVRGEADAIALKLRYHNADRSQPRGAAQRTRARHLRRRRAGARRGDRRQRAWWACARIWARRSRSIAASAASPASPSARTRRSPEVLRLLVREALTGASRRRNARKRGRALARAAQRPRSMPTWTAWPSRSATRAPTPRRRGMLSDLELERPPRIWIRAQQERGPGHRGPGRSREAARAKAASRSRRRPSPRWKANKVTPATEDAEDSARARGRDGRRGRRGTARQARPRRRPLTTAATSPPITPSPPSSTRWSRRGSVRPRRADAAARSCSTSSSRTCRPWWPSSPTGCSAGCWRKQNPLLGVRPRGRPARQRAAAARRSSTR